MEWPRLSKGQQSEDPSRHPHREFIASAQSVVLNPAPIHASWVHEGNPVARNAILWHSPDREAMTLVWDCSAGKFDWFYDIDETIYFIEGSAVIRGDTFAARRFVPGDVLLLPKGTKAYWEVEHYVRKVAFCRAPPPKLAALVFQAFRKMRPMVTGSQRAEVS